MVVTYEIEKGTNAVKVFIDGNTKPSLYQPNWPSGESWANSSEADSWAKLYVASIEDPNAPYAPIKKGEAGRQKPTADQIAAIDAAKQALNQATTPDEILQARTALNSALKAAYPA